MPSSVSNLSAIRDACDAMRCGVCDAITVLLALALVRTRLDPRRKRPLR